MMSTKPVEVRGVTCADCGSEMRLRDSRFGPFYGCSRFPACRGAHGAHPDGRPLGTPANRATKDARIAAHAAFDPLWLKGELTGKRKREARELAYSWLAARLGVEPDACHIGEFDEPTCAAVVLACEGVTPADVLGANLIARLRGRQATANADPRRRRPPLSPHA